MSIVIYCLSHSHCDQAAAAHEQGRHEKRLIMFEKSEK